jgi:hypothetical protein
LITTAVLLMAVVKAAVMAAALSSLRLIIGG